MIEPTEDGPKNSDFRMRVQFGDFLFSASGPHRLVVEAYDRVRRELDSAPSIMTGSESGADRIVPSGANGNDEYVPLPVFLQKRVLDTNALKAAAIVHWAQRHEGQDRLTPSDVEEYWKKTPYRLPANVARDLGTAANHGWVRQEGHGEYSPTGFGSTEIDRRKQEG